MKSVIKIIVLIVGLFIISSCDNEVTDVDTDVDTAEDVYLEERFEYSLLNDGSVIINKYISKEEVSVLVIPSSIYVDDYDNDPFNNNKTVSYIDSYAFSDDCNGNINIKEVVIPSTIKEIGEYAFYNNHYLEKISFANNSNYKEINRGTFSNIFNLKEFRILDSVNYISEEAFNGSGIECFIDNENYIWQNNLLINVNVSNKDNLIAIYANPNVSEIIFPDNVRIVYDLFKNNKNIKKVDLNDVTHIGYDTFYNSSLEEIVNGDNVISASINTFYNTPWLLNNSSDMIIIGKVLLKYSGNDKELVINEGINMIGINSFSSDLLEKITLPSSLEAIGDKAFINCKNLKTVIFNSSRIVDITEEIFNKITTLYVLDGYLDRYKRTVPYMFIENEILEIKDLKE